jgi:hypothetical protein
VGMGEQTVYSIRRGRSLFNKRGVLAEPHSSRTNYEYSIIRNIINKL